MTSDVSKPPRRSQAERTAATSALLIDATIDCLYHKGYSATSTSLVAKMAGVSRGAMLHHFATKVDLMSAVVRATYKSDLRAYSKVFGDISKGEDALDKLIETAWDCFQSPGGIAQTEIWLAVRSDPDLAKAVLPLRVELDSRSVDALTLVMNQYGFKRTITIEGLLCYMVATLRGLSIQRVLGTPQPELEMGVAMIKRLAHSAYEVTPENKDQVRIHLT